MISQVDIDDWDQLDFEQIVEEMPEADKKVKLRDGPDGELIIDMKPFIEGFGRALVARIKMTVKV
jgi:hypothetical protein